MEVQSAKAAQPLESSLQDEVEGFIGEAVSRIDRKMLAPPGLACNAACSGAVEDSLLERSEKFDSSYSADVRDKSSLRRNWRRSFKPRIGKPSSWTWSAASRKIK